MKRHTRTKTVPIMELFPNAQKINFKEIAKGDVIGVIDHLETGNSLRINIASFQTGNPNFWYRRGVNKLSGIESASDINDTDIFLIHRPADSQKPLDAFEEEALLHNIFHEHAQATMIGYKEIEKWDLVGMFTESGLILIDYAYDEDENGYGWFTEEDRYITGVANNKRFPSLYYRFSI